MHLALLGCLWGPETSSLSKLRWFQNLVKLHLLHFDSSPSGPEKPSNKSDFIVTLFSYSYHRVYPPRAFRRSRMRSGIVSISLVHSSTSMPCQTSCKRSLRLVVLSGRFPRCRFILLHKFPMGSRSGKWDDHINSRTLLTPNQL
jgi:hypothetical protein